MFQVVAVVFVVDVVDDLLLLLLFFQAQLPYHVQNVSKFLEKLKKNIRKALVMLLFPVISSRRNSKHGS